MLVTKTIDTSYKGTTADCRLCKGAGSYVTDDFNLAEGERLVIQVCTRCHNVDGLPLVSLPAAVRTSIPTDRQIAYIGALIAELEELGDDEIKGRVMKVISNYDVPTASKCIKALQLRKAQRLADKAAAAPTQERASAQVSYQDVPAGRYAVASLTGNNDLDFFHVTIGKDGGRWAGFRFVAQIAGDNEFPVRGAQARKALEAIVKAGTNEAGALYGQEIGCCFNCHIHLTRKYSRSMGYGPDCADNLGLPFDHAEYARSPKIEAEVAA